MKLEKQPPAYLTQTILRPGDVPKQPAGRSGPSGPEPISVKNLILFCIGFVAVAGIFCVGSIVGMWYFGDYQIRNKIVEVANANKAFDDAIGEIKAGELSALVSESVKVTTEKREYGSPKVYVYDLVTAADGDSVKFHAYYPNSTATLTELPTKLDIFNNKKLIATIEN